MSIPVILVLMPLASLKFPSLALSLFKTGLRQRGISSKILYLNHRFARSLGEEKYTRLLEEHLFGRNYLLGEWIFADSLFGRSGEIKDSFPDCVPRAPRPPFSSETGNDVALPDQVLGARHWAASFLDACADEVADYKPRIVAFSSIFHQHVASLALARLLKQRINDVRIIFGGNNCHGMKGIETLKRFPFVDAVISGEGDLLFPELVASILAEEQPPESEGLYLQSDIPSIDEKHCRDAPAVSNLDDLPVPDFSDYFEEFESHRKRKAVGPIILLETSRGCWWRKKGGCNFCSLNAGDLNYRRKTSARALREIEYVSRIYPSKEIQMTDSVLPPDYFHDFIPKLSAIRNWSSMFYEVKANLTKRQVRLLRDAGILDIQPGIESLSTEVLEKMNKGTTACLNVQVLRWSRQYGMNAWWNLLWGIPQVSSDSYRKMADLLPSLYHLQPPSRFSPIYIGRFSNYFERPHDFGVTEIRPCSIYGNIYPFDEATISRLAHFFDHHNSHIDEPIIASISEIVADWTSKQATSKLFFIDGIDRAFIWDTRPVATNTLIPLTALQRNIYLVCDSARQIDHIGSLVSTKMRKPFSNGQIAEELDFLIQRKLVMEDRGKYLSLAVFVEPENTAEALKQIGAYLSDGMPSDVDFPGLSAKLKLRPDDRTVVSHDEIVQALCSMRNLQA